MKSAVLVALVLLLAALPVSFGAGEPDNCFVIIDTEVPAAVVPGQTFSIGFIVRDYDLDEFQPATAYLDPCPQYWKCEERVVAYGKSGDYRENLTVTLPDDALPQKHTLTVRMRSEWEVQRGMDRVMIKIVSPEDFEVMSVEEFKARQAESGASNPALAVLKQKDDGVGEVVVPNASEVSGDTGVLGVVEDVIPMINASEVRENVERLQTSRQFMEFATVALLLVLIFVAVGAYSAFTRSRKDAKGR